MTKAKIRKWHTDQALSSVSKLHAVINDMTMEEIVHCLELEASSSRRKSIIDRLISKAARLNELQFVANLKEKYHGTSRI